MSHHSTEYEAYTVNRMAWAGLPNSALDLTQRNLCATLSRDSFIVLMPLNYPVNGLAFQFDS